MNAQERLTNRKVKETLVGDFLTATILIVFMVLMSDRSLSLDADMRSALVYHEIYIMGAIMWACDTVREHFRSRLKTAAIGRPKFSNEQAIWVSRHRFSSLPRYFFGKYVTLSFCMIAAAAVLAALYVPASVIFEGHAAALPFLWTVATTATMTLFYSLLLALAVGLPMSVFVFALAPGDKVDDKRAFVRSVSAIILAREVAYEDWKAREAA